MNSYFGANVQTDEDRAHMQKLVATVAKWLKKDCLDTLKDQGTSSGTFFDFGGRGNIAC